MKLLLICIIILLKNYVSSQADGRYRPSVQTTPKYYTQPEIRNKVSSNSNSDGRYRPANDGRYRPESDGRYNPGNDGRYVHIDERYKHIAVGGGDYSGGGGQYSGSSDYIGDGEKYIGSNEKFKGNAGTNKGNIGNVGGNFGQNLGRNSDSSLIPPRIIPTVQPRTTSRIVGDSNDIRKDWKIIQVDNLLKSDGYRYFYETQNGILAEQSGQIENFAPGSEGLRSKGWYEYTGDDGNVYRVDYVADNNGFVAQGAHIPTVPPHVEKLLAYLASKNV